MVILVNFGWFSEIFENVHFNLFSILLKLFDLFQAFENQKLVFNITIILIFEIVISHKKIRFKTIYLPKKSTIIIYIETWWLNLCPSMSTSIEKLVSRSMHTTFPIANWRTDSEMRKKEKKNFDFQVGIFDKNKLS